MKRSWRIWRHRNQMGVTKSRLRHGAGNHAMGEVHDTLVPLDCNRGIQIAGPPERFRADAGVGVLRELAERLGLFHLVREHLEDPREPTRNQHPIVELVRTRILALAQSREGQNDVRRLRGDAAFRLAVKQGETALRAFRGQIPSRAVLASFLGFSAGIGCTGSEVDPISQLTLQDVLDQAQVITLMESDTVLNVNYTLRVTSTGHFLLADGAENRIRLYEPDGTLVFQVGAPGDGPGEYRRAEISVAAPDGRIWGFDAHGKVIIYDENGSGEHEIRLPFILIYDVHPVNDTIAIVAARSQNPEHDQRLHFVDLIRGTVLESFFPAEVPDELEATANSVGFSHFAVRNDRIYSTFALKDTVFVFDSGGRALERIPIPAEGIRPPRPVTPETSRSMRAISEWAASFSLVADVFPLCEQQFIVQYQDRENMLPVWRWVRFHADGELHFELRDVPRLLDVRIGPACQPQLIFHSPDALTHQEILFAELVP